MQQQVCLCCLLVFSAGCADRAVNALLTHLDRLRACPNVLILATSNLAGAVDAAFVDRADIKAYIGPPGPQVCLLQLAPWQVHGPSLHC